MIGAFIAWSDRPNSPGYIIAENGCNIWVGALSGGYSAAWDSINKRQSSAHRIRYEREIGPIPEGLELDHKCDNRACCNPAHLRPVTPRENTLRGDTVTSANAAKTHCPAGHVLAGDNLACSLKKLGERRCKTCVRDRARAIRSRAKKELA